MGQTDGTYSVIDHDGMKWTWFYICPYCGCVLATLRLVDDMELDGDDVIGCDDCALDIGVESAALVMIDEDGNRA